MQISIKIGNRKQAQQLTDVLRTKLGWVNPCAILVTNLQSTVTVEVAKDYCSVPHVLNLIAEQMSELKVGT